MSTPWSVSKLSSLIAMGLTLGIGAWIPSTSAQINPSLCDRYPQDLRCSLFNYTRQAPGSTPALRPQQPRIAVLEFQGQSSPALSSLVIDQLVESGSYLVVERGATQALLAEQDLGAQGRLDPATAAQIGRLLGVDAVVIGAVTQSDVSSRQSGGGFPVLAPLGRSPIAVGATTRDVDATVRLNARLVSTTTGEILTTATGTGSASQSSSTVTIAGIGGGSEVDNRAQLLSQATDQAIAQIIPQLNAASTLLQNSSPAGIPGVIADVTQNQVIINRGTGHGYQVGQILTIERVVRQVKDPETGEPLREIKESIGQVQLTEVDDRSSVGVILTGTDLAIGDLAHPDPNRSSTR